MGRKTTVAYRIRVKQESDLVDYVIVAPDKADPAHGFISWDSPLAKTLKNKCVGQELKAFLPSGKEVTMIILHIERSYLGY